MGHWLIFWKVGLFAIKRSIFKFTTQKQIEVHMIINCLNVGCVNSDPFLVCWVVIVVQMRFFWAQPYILDKSILTLKEKDEGSGQNNFFWAQILSISMKRHHLTTILFWDFRKFDTPFCAHKHREPRTPLSLNIIPLITFELTLFTLDYGNMFFAGRILWFY